jgi:hypothetical protein
MKSSLPIILISAVVTLVVLCGATIGAHYLDLIDLPFLSDNTSMINIDDTLQQQVYNDHESHQMQEDIQNEVQSYIVTASDELSDIIFSIDGLVFGEMNIDDVFAKYSGRDDFRPTPEERAGLIDGWLVTEAHVAYSMRDDSTNGYWFIQEFDADIISRAIVTEPWLLLGRYYIGDDATQLLTDLNVSDTDFYSFDNGWVQTSPRDSNHFALTFVQGNLQVTFTIENGLISMADFQLI